MQALNDLFEKLLQRDVPSRYLLRLGMGEAELATSQDFSRVGRVNTMLARRIELLAEVLPPSSQSAGLIGQVGFSLRCSPLRNSSHLISAIQL